VEHKSEKWNKQEWETKTSFVWFIRYLELGTDRSLEKLLEKYSKSKGYIAQLWKWSSLYNWVSRADAYDISILDKAQKINEKKEIQKTAKRLETMEKSKDEAASIIFEMLKNKISTSKERVFSDMGFKENSIKITDLLKILEILKDETNDNNDTNIPTYDEFKRKYN
jgi:hypothetical protein